MKRKALRVRSEGSIPPYVTEAESRKQHSDSPLCNSLQMGFDYLRHPPRLQVTDRFATEVGEVGDGGEVGAGEREKS